MADIRDARKLRIAIVGGGIAGATLIHVLLKYTHLDVHIYEAGPEFSERGAAVGLSSNAQAALAEMDPALIQTLTDAGAVSMNSTRVVIGCGPHTGEVLMELAKEKQSWVVHRAALLSGLLKPVPRDVMHTNKKLVRVSEASDKQVCLYFEDGSKEHVDALIGGDGIHGCTRKYIVGDHPSAAPDFAGFWDCRFLVPIERARQVLGEEYFEEDRQYGWCGEGSFFMHDVLNNGESVQCVASAMTSNWGDDEWNGDLDRKTLEESFAGWRDSPVASGMIELLLGDPDLRAYPQMHHKVNAPTFARGPVCMIGDAAHTMTPWQGSGAGQAIEDAMILDGLLKEVEEPHQLAPAFKAFDEVRRPRSQRIVDSSANTGRIMCGKEPGVGLIPEMMREALGPRWGFIFGIDVKEHKREALAKFAEIKP